MADYTILTFQVVFRRRQEVHVDAGPLPQEAVQNPMVIDSEAGAKSMYVLRICLITRFFKLLCTFNPQARRRLGMLVLIVLTTISVNPKTKCICSSIKTPSILPPLVMVLRSYGTGQS